MDTEGNGIGTDVTRTISTATTLSDIAPAINGYTYSKATLNSVNGTELKQLQYTSKWGGQYYWQYRNTTTGYNNWTNLGNNDTVYFVYQRLLPTITITDDIVNNGCLNAVYAPNNTTATVTGYKWYRSTLQNGSYDEVEKVDYQGNKSNLSNDNSKLYPAYDSGAQKWYKVKATLSDGTEIESAPFQVPYYDSLQNGSFETPTVTGGFNNQWSNAYYKENNGVWQTTGTNNGRDIEIVKQGANGGAGAYSWSGDWGSAAVDGSQFAELNAEAAGALYQDVLTMEGTPLNYWLSHRARGNNPDATQYDTMFLVIVPTKTALEKNLTTQDNLKNYLNQTLGLGTVYDTPYTTAESQILKNENGVLVMRVTSSNQSWQDVLRASGYTPTSSLTRFFFMAGKTASGDDTVGNFLDKVGFSQSLPPVNDDEFTFQVEKKFAGLGSEDIAKVKAALQFKINVKKGNKTLSNSEVEALFGRTTISGSEMTELPDGSLVYTIANKKITKGDKYEVTITEENAELNGYTLKSSAQTKVTNGENAAATTTDGSVIGELQGKTTAIVTFTNTYEEANYKNVNFKKIWDDNGNEFSTRPDELTVTLHASYVVEEDGKTVEKTLDDLTKTAVLNETNGWQCSWRTPVYHILDDGTKVKIQYKVTEGDLDSEYVYVSETGNVAVSGDGTGYTYTDFSNVKLSPTKDNAKDTSENTGVLSKIASRFTMLLSKNSAAVATQDAANTSQTSNLGDPAHKKYIEYNAATAEYTLNLDVTGAKGTAPGVDVLFVIDTSGSMGGNYSTLLSQVKTLLTKKNGIVDKIFEKQGNVNSVSYVSFAGANQTDKSAWYNSSNKAAFKSAINSLNANGGTNWTYAMMKASELMGEKSSSTNEKVVIFLSDGKPTYSYTTDRWGGHETGNGGDTYSSYYQDAADQVTGSTALRNAQMYSVYLTQGTKDGMKAFSEKLTNSDLVDGTKLDTALTTILNKVIPTYKNVEIKDTLSQYVDFAEATPTITVTKKTSAGATSTLDPSQYTATVSGKTVTVRLLNGASLEDGSTYTLSFKVKPSDAANSYYAEHGTYPNTGDAQTGTTSAGQPGFYSNDDSKTSLTYQIDGTDGTQTTAYPKPVVQVTTHKLSYEKTWNKPDSVETPTGDVRLNVTYSDGTRNTITLTSANDYKYEETVPVTKTISSITEDAIDGYTPSYDISADGTTATVTNSYSKVTASSITVVKRWEGSGDKTPIRVSLYQSTDNGQATQYGDTITLDDSNNWTYTWHDLPQSVGTAGSVTNYTYAVREENIPSNYTSNITYEYGEDTTTATITNVYDENCADENYYIANVLQTEKLNISKIWQDNNNKEELRPSTLPVTVNGINFTLKADDDWKTTATILKKKDRTYEAHEYFDTENANAYEQKGDANILVKDDGADITFTNTLKTKSITVKKEWNDGEVTDRPANVQYKLMYRKSDTDEWQQYGEQTYTITAENIQGEESWVDVINNLPAMYQYKVEEITAYPHYKTDVSSSGDTYTITNTLNWSARKTDQNGSTGLKGAEFELNDSDGNTIATGKSESDGKIAWTLVEGVTVDLDSLNGTYTIHETKAPEGYVKSDTDWTVTFENGLLTKLDNQDAQNIESSAANGVVVTLTNQKVYELPSTGGTGIFVYMIGGMVLMGAAAWILYRNKRREVLKR